MPAASTSVEMNHPATPRGQISASSKEKVTFELPLIPKPLFFIGKGLRKLGILTLLEWLGLYRSKVGPYLRSGKLNPRYVQMFTEKYADTVHYAPEQLNYVPTFSLQNKYQGKRFVIFGNGPSLKKFPFEKIKEAITIGTNTASEFYDGQYVLISSAPAFIRAQKHFDFNRSQLLVASTLWNGWARKDIWNQHMDRIVPLWTAPGSWSIEDGRFIGSGPTVGQLAVDVALSMGAKSILLVGCDGYKKRSLEEMYAGNYAGVYRYALSRRGSLKTYVQMLWDRDDAIHKDYFQKQNYCQSKRIQFAVWGEDCQYDKLKKVKDSNLSEWC